MPSIYSNCIAIDLPPYVETLARRVVVARRNPTIPKSQRAFAEARDYLLHRRIEVPHLRVWSSPRPSSGRTMCDGIVHHSRWGPPPPMPTMAEIDALFGRKTAKPARKPRSIVPPPPPVAPALPAPVEVSFLLFDFRRNLGVTGSDLPRLAEAMQRDGSTNVIVFVAAGLHPIVLNRYHRGFDPDRWILNAGCHDVVTLLNDPALRRSLSSLA